MTWARTALVALTFGAFLTSCQSATSHREAVEDTAGHRVSAGTVQREIRVGMSGAEVARVLGSPNIVTTDEQRREAWIYDKISTTSVYSTSSGEVAANSSSGLALLSVPALIISSVQAQSRGASGATTTSQKTFTVIIKFDETGRVRDFAYHTSRF